MGKDAPGGKPPSKDLLADIRDVLADVRDLLTCERQAAPLDDAAIIRIALRRMAVEGYRSTLWKKVPRRALETFGRRVLDPATPVEVAAARLRESAGRNIQNRVSKSACYRFAARLREAVAAIQNGHRADTVRSRRPAKSG